jgi:hypothetical protein
MVDKSHDKDEFESLRRLLLFSLLKKISSLFSEKISLSQYLLEDNKLILAVGVQSILIRDPSAFNLYS